MASESVHFVVTLDDHGDAFETISMEPIQRTRSIQTIVNRCRLLIKHPALNRNGIDPDLMWNHSPQYAIPQPPIRLTLTQNTSIQPCMLESPHRKVLTHMPQIHSSSQVGCTFHRVEIEDLDVGSDIDHLLDHKPTGGELTNWVVWEDS